MNFHSTLLKFLVWLIIICNDSPVFGSHIIGGEFAYECLDLISSSDSVLFEISYNIFLNCEETVIENSLLLKCRQNINDDVKVFEVYLDTIVLLDNIDYSCAQYPPNLCVEKRMYKAQIYLDSNNINSVLISNHNCCRPASLVNITGVEVEDFGATHFLEILPSSIELCNSSPKFQDSPPIFICSNEFIQINQSGVDEEGDQLIYELCEVFGIETLWSTAPPFPVLQYLLPNFSPLHPLGQDIINIDATTGVISGYPQIVGAYVVGICVSEYRNGEYLGTIRRDIQLNVVECTPFVTVGIEADEITSDDTYIINSCNNQTPTFINTSEPVDNISDLLWSFNLENEIVTSLEWSPSIYFEVPGSYTGNLILNPQDECSDTLDFIVNIVEDIFPDFNATFDTCVSGTVQFSNMSYSLGSELSTFVWDFGDDTFSNEIAPEQTYENPGTFDVQLKVIDEFGCSDSLINMVDWRPAPAIIIISPEIDASCAPLSTKFNNLSWPIDSNYIFVWDFGDDTVSSNNMNPNHEYLQEGLYDVSISVTSPIGCTADTVFQELITVAPPPSANFSYDPQALTQFENEIYMLDNSQEAVSWRWFFDDIDSTWLNEPTYIFADTGVHTIKLIVEDFYGCTDTMYQLVDVVPQVNYFLPNAFSPNGDGINDIFHAKGFVDEILKFELSIFDRWGGLLFATTNPMFEWNGLHQKSAKQVNKGVYVYQMTYITRRGKTIQDRGYVNLIR